MTKAFAKLSMILPGIVIGLTAIFIFEIASSKKNDTSILQVTPSAYSCDAKPGDQVNSTFSVKNLTGKTVKILGSETSCGCTAVINEFPLVLQPNAVGEIKITVSVGSSTKSNLYIRKARLITDCKGNVPLLVCNVNVLK